jgi:hypothetical protein
VSCRPRYVDLAENVHSLSLTGPSGAGQWNAHYVDHLLRVAAVERGHLAPTVPTVTTPSPTPTIPVVVVNGPEANAWEVVGAIGGDAG